MKPWQFSLTELLAIAVAVIALAFAFGHAVRANRLKHDAKPEAATLP